MNLACVLLAALMLAGCLESTRTTPETVWPGDACRAGEGRFATVCAGSAVAKAGPPPSPEHPAGLVLEFSVLAGQETAWAWTSSGAVSFQVEEHPRGTSTPEEGPVVRALEGTGDGSSYIAQRDAAIILRWTAGHADARVEYEVRSEGIPPY